MYESSFKMIMRYCHTSLMNIIKFDISNLLRIMEVDREGDKCLFSFWGFCLSKLIFTFISPNTEFFLVRIFPYSDRIYSANHSVNLLIQSEYLKIRTRKKLRIWTLFTQCFLGATNERILVL